MRTEIIAHRGASYLANHENTMEAFRLAIDMHADYIECDVRQTIDKVLIIHHDPSIQHIMLNTITYEEANVLAQKQGFEIPTLSDVLNLCKGRIRMLIELKEAGYERRVVSLIKSVCEYDEYAIQSFYDIVVRRIKKMDSFINVGLLIGQEDADFRTRFNEFFPIRRLTECHADFVSTHYAFATPDFIYRLHRAGFPVYIWTVDSPNWQAHFLSFNAEGLITNRPDAAMYLRAKNERQRKSESTHTKASLKKKEEVTDTEAETVE